MCHPHAIPKPQSTSVHKLSLPSFISQIQRHSLKKISQSCFRTKHNNNVVHHLFILIHSHQTNNPILFIHHLYYFCNKHSISVTQKKAHMPPCISYSSPCPTLPARPVPDQEPPEFSPPVPGRYDQPSAPPELPGISTPPDVDPTTVPPPEVNPYPPPLDPGPNPGPDFPVPPLKPPPVPDIPPPFPDNPIPKPDVVPPQPPDIVPPPPPGPEIIPPPPTGPGGPIVV